MTTTTNNNKKHVNYNVTTKALYSTLIQRYTEQNKVFFTFTDGKQVYEVKPSNVVGYKDFFIVNGLLKDVCIIGYKGKKINDDDYQIYFSIRPAYSEKDKMHNFHEEVVKTIEPMIRASLKRSVVDNKMTFNKVKFNRSYGDFTYNKETSERKVIKASNAVLCALYSTLDNMIDDDKTDKDVRACFAVNLDNMNKAVIKALEIADKENRELAEKENERKTATTINKKAVERFEKEHNLQPAAV